MDSDAFTIFCRNVSSKVTEEILYELFLQAGPLKSVKIPKTAQGGSKGYAFIEYLHECSVDYAIQLFHHTALYGQELHLKPRRKNDSVHPCPGRNFEMQRTSSLPIIIPNQHIPINMHLQPPMHFLRPQLIPGHMIPAMNPMFNHVIGMPMPSAVPHHIHFNDEGLPRSESIAIPTAVNERYQDPGAASSYHNITNNKRRFDDHNSRHVSHPEDKKARYSHSAKYEDHERQDRRSSYGNDNRHEVDFRRYGSDNRLHRMDHIDNYQDDRRHRPSRSYHEDDHQESRSNNRERPYNRDRKNNHRY